MTINAKCSHCGQKYETESEYIGSEATCQICGSSFKIEAENNQATKVTEKQNNYVVGWFLIAVIMITVLMYVSNNSIASKENKHRCQIEQQVKFAIMKEVETYEYSSEKILEMVPEICQKYDYDKVEEMQSFAEDYMKAEKNRIENAWWSLSAFERDYIKHPPRYYFDRKDLEENLKAKAMLKWAGIGIYK